MNIFKKTSEQLEQYYDDQDSLAAIIEDIYVNTDAYFRNSGNENMAALSLMGGWVEALYIGSTMYESGHDNKQMAETILQQKYSLNSILTMLSNHQESLEVAEYILMLKKLKKIYEKVDILYHKEGFQVDTTHKLIKTTSAQIRYDPDTLDEVLRVIKQVRAEIIKVDLE